jgi:hypothetical protein
MACVLGCFAEHSDQEHAQRCRLVVFGPVRYVAWGVQSELGDCGV